MHIPQFSANWEFAKGFATFPAVLQNLTKPRKLDSLSMRGLSRFIEGFVVKEPSPLGRRIGTLRAASETVRREAPDDSEIPMGAAGFVRGCCCEARGFARSWTLLAMLSAKPSCLFMDVMMKNTLITTITARSIFRIADFILKELENYDFFIPALLENVLYSRWFNNAH
jgi:hypothetical protein